MAGRAIAAALTPLKDGGVSIDDAAFGPYVAFLQAGGVDGVLALGTTGEGILLDVAERAHVIDLFAAEPLPVIAHCGAQTTADTITLARHAAAAGVAGVAVIGPPYFVLDDDALLAHFLAAAEACAPLPFYVYEFERAAGYAVPLGVIAQLRERAPNLAGLKVSDAPLEKLTPYLLEGLDVFVGAESLIGDGLARGAAGAVSALASTFPEVVADAVATGDSTRAGALRNTVERYPRHAGLKAIVASKGVPMREDVRGPLRGLTDAERAGLLADVASF
jgi:dihydrodipicolinate synthase/N-acetylneuraminate lyase